MNLLSPPNLNSLLPTSKWLWRPRNKHLNSQMSLFSFWVMYFFSLQFSSLISCSSIMTIIMMAACLPMILQTSFILFLTLFLHGLIIPSLLSITRIRMRIRMNTIFPSCRFSLHFLIKIVSILLVLLIPFPMEMDSSLSQDISPTGLSSCVSILMSVSIPLCCWASPKPLMMWVFLQSISNRSFSLSPSSKEVDAKQYDIYNRNTIHA